MLEVRFIVSDVLRTQRRFSAALPLSTVDVAPPCGHAHAAAKTANGGTTRPLWRGMSV